MVNYDRPLTLSLLAFILWLIALVLIAASVYVFFFGGQFWNDGILQFVESESLQIFIIIGFSLLLVFAGIGILTSSSAARALLIALSILVIIHGLFVFLSETLPGIIVMVIGAWVLLYMFTSGVVDAFSSIDSRKTVDALNTLESYRRSRNL
jgi:hypothetical protein